MPERDASQEALDQVEKATESGPVSGEDLLSSPDLKRKLREAKEAEAEAKEQRKHEPPSP